MFTALGIAVLIAAALAAALRSERRGLISPRPYNNRHNDAAGAREDHLG